MDLSNFYVGKDRAPLSLVLGDFTLSEANLWPLDLGKMSIPSGAVGVADPLWINNYFLSFDTPKTEGKVVITLADLSQNQDKSHIREAYFSLLFSNETPSKILAAMPNGDFEELEEDYSYTVPVDACVLSFFDRDSMTKYLDAHGQIEVAEQGVYEWMNKVDHDGEHPAGAAVVYYNEGEDRSKLFITHSGWGDGFYPILKTVDSEGNMLGLHVDFQVLG